MVLKRALGYFTHTVFLVSSDLLLYPKFLPVRSDGFKQVHKRHKQSRQKVILLSKNTGLHVSSLRLIVFVLIRNIYCSVYLKFCFIVIYIIYGRLLFSNTLKFSL